MSIYSVYIVSKSGGLIYNYEHTVPKVDTEKTFTYPLNITLKEQNVEGQTAIGGRGVNLPTGVHCPEHRPQSMSPDLAAIRRYVQAARSLDAVREPTVRPTVTTPMPAVPGFPNLSEEEWQDRRREFRCTRLGQGGPLVY